MQKDYVTVPELAEALDVDQSTVYRWVRRGLVKVIRVGPRLVRIPLDERDRLLRGERLP